MSPHRHLAVLALCLVPASAAFAGTGSASARHARPAQAGSATPAGESRPQNVILMIADGFGPASFTLAAEFAEQPLALESLLLGVQATSAANSPVTDSAASATAMASGIKTNNGAVGVDVAGKPVRTLLEAAEAKGMATGLVATSRITHATPAAFSAHVPRRDMEGEIALQQIDQGIEVLFGGGMSSYHGEALERARQAGYSITDNRDGFDAMGADSLPVLALLTESHMAYEIDRDPAQEPSLAEMTAKAIALLDPLPGGFFLMVEGSRIDHAGHQNDPAAHLRDILAYDAAVKVAAEFAGSDGTTLVVSTADHETGGMTLGVRIGDFNYYDWRGEVLGAVRASGDVLAEKLRASAEWEAALAEWGGIEKLTKSEREGLEDALAEEDEGVFRDALLALISKRARIGWTTGGHTAVDVQVFGAGPGSERFVGRRDNTLIALTIAELLGVELLGVGAAD